MTQILHDFTTEALSQAIEANQWELFRLLRHWPKVDVHDESEMLWAISNIPLFFFNSVLRANLAAEAVDPAIQSVISRGQARNVPRGWYIGPTTVPADLGAQLEVNNFTLAAREAGMAVDLQSMNDNLPAPWDLLIDVVENAQSLQT